jgi:probable F420-dependent oxidoreductase
VKIRIGTGPGVGAGTAFGGDDGGQMFADYIEASERIGWDSLWFSERIAGNLLDPMAAMGVAIGRSQRLKYGTSVLVLPGRNPVLLAKELATLDVLSKGRIVPVFGLGSPLPSEHELFGVTRGERAGRTDEAVRLIVKLWTEDHVTFEGKFFSVHDVTLGPKPVQQPHPDVWFGGHSEAACRRVGRIGTGWLPSFVAPSEYKRRVDVIRAEAERHQREIEEDHYGALVAYIPAGGEAMTETVLSVLSARRPEVDPRDVLVTGGDAALRAKLEEFYAQGVSKFVVIPAVPPADWTDELQRVHDNVVKPLEN